MRDYLDHLKVLIIDEISFVGADMLYRIHYRLKEIFQTPDNVLFGGLSVILVGDLLQLPPVQESMVFKKPNNVKLNWSCPKCRTLYDEKNIPTRYGKN